MAKLNKSHDELGAKTVVMCESAWSCQEWEGFGVLEWPDIEALQKHMEVCAEVDWFRYLHAFTINGIEWPAEEPTASGD